jgi:hypothetical protein
MVICTTAVPVNPIQALPPLQLPARSFEIDKDCEVFCLVCCGNGEKMKGIFEMIGLRSSYPPRSSCAACAAAVARVPSQSRDRILQGGETG